jgi:hypothetical protein
MTPSRPVARARQVFRREQHNGARADPVNDDTPRTVAAVGEPPGRPGRMEDTMSDTLNRPSGLRDAEPDELRDSDTEGHRIAGGDGAPDEAIGPGEKLRGEDRDGLRDSDTEGHLVLRRSSGERGE